MTLFGLVFEEWPTYEEIVFGTPKLRPTVALIQATKESDSVTVHRDFLDWNTWRDEIRGWNNARTVVDEVKARTAIQTRERAE